MLKIEELSDTFTEVQDLIIITLPLEAGVAKPDLLSTTKAHFKSPASPRRFSAYQTLKYSIFIVG